VALQVPSLATQLPQTMRDPIRIQRILNKLAAAWKASPDLRLGQLVDNVTHNIVTPHGTVSLFDAEDSIVEASLDGWLVDHNIKVSGGWQS
jgi:hypothetical protein